MLRKNKMYLEVTRKVETPQDLCYKRFKLNFFHLNETA